MKANFIATIVVAVLLTGPAAAQPYVGAPCRSLVTAPSFDHAQHGLWYRRFWTGDCTGLIFCQPGEPSWNQVVSILKSRAAAPKAAAVTRRACLLGQRIGFEWARDNNVRRIDTADLAQFVSTVQGASNVEAGLATVEAAVRERLGR